MKIVIVGGVAGGASAAARIRRLDEQAQIVIFERTGYVSYASCGLPYYIGGVIADDSSLAVQTPDSLWDRFRIDARVRHEVTAINRERKTVSVRSLDTEKEYEENYDKLILSPGALPIRPPIKGLDGKRIFTLRTVEDALRIHTAVTERGIKSAVIIGGGSVGIEAAENLRHRGLEVTVIDAQEQVLPQTDRDMASFVHAELRKNGIKLLLGARVEEFEDTDIGVTAKIKNSEPVTADIVLLAVGVRPDSTLAKAAGLRLGIKNSIAVNDRMQTSDADIYAVGDAVEITSSVTGRAVNITLAGPANKQGRIAADNIAGLDSRYRGVAGTSVVKVFGLTVATTGINENTAKALGMSYEKIILSQSSHASYYPDGRVLTLKLIFEKVSGKILGAQAVGADGADKRIDVIATAMQAGMTADRLGSLDLAYAPPYSSAKDPVNLAGFMAENIMTGKVKQFFYEDIPALPHDGSVRLIDTRTRGEYLRGHAEGFENIPLDDLRERLDELCPSRPVYVMCQSGLRSYIACRILTQEGYNCFNFAGGYRLYESMENDRRICGKETS